jgi:hypothetical protein
MKRTATSLKSRYHRISQRLSNGILNPLENRQLDEKKVFDKSETSISSQIISPLDRTRDPNLFKGKSVFFLSQKELIQSAKMVMSHFSQMLIFNSSMNLKSFL